MTAPNSNSFINTNPQPAPTPTPQPPRDCSVETSTVSYTVSHTIVPPLPTNQTEAFLKRHKLVLTAGAGAVTSTIAGAAVCLEGKKYSQSQKQIYINTYDRCRQDNSFSNEDAIFHLTTNGFSDNKIIDLLTSSRRIKPLKEGQINCMIKVNGIKTVSTSQCETEQAKQVPPQPGASHSTNIVNALIDMNEGIPHVRDNIKKQLIENGQILILDSKDCDSDILDREEGEDVHYICVEPLPSESPDNPKSNYPQRYTVLVICFAGLAGLFGILCVKFLRLTKEQEYKEQEYIDAPEKFYNLRYHGRINKEVDNNLINILIKCQQRVISLNETRALLIKECSFSKTAIDEILKNL